MLYQRILTAIPLAAFVCWIIFFQPTSVFFYFVLFIVLIAAYEWARLSAVQNIYIRGLYALVIAAIAWAIQQHAADYIPWAIFIAVMWWFSITFYLRFARPKAVSPALKVDKLLVAFLVLPAAALAMYKIHGFQAGLHMQGPALLFYALSLVWVADIGAYFSGKKFGKNKLAPHISPGKTKEGLLGAVITTSIYTLVASFYFELDRDRAIMLVMLSVIVTFISVTGDLYISFLKREAGLKDSGNILPGHGGMLDRVDSVLAAMPVFLLGFSWWIYSSIL
ncbi:MAG: phosphatidate cytidylyltransferase [Gammaproteobacteria bacterium]|nr:phosphatidate cytidylyltransferase [Gammaproteobacteria bacterium]MBT8134802.1 phosphatidate cytidylyltransferase [Gammaproteobacteria bacterium]NNJ48991.1 phosphatidate cytidylyltransferase [Gammaproteobacteria bacterium]